MFRLLTLGFATGLAYLFFEFVGHGQLQAILQPMSVALSVFTAAVLVRLARGMPTLDWKSVPLESRKNLTKDLVEVSREYAGLLLLLILLVIVNVVLIGIGSRAMCLWPPLRMSLVSSAVGFAFGLTFARMAYVVWRDLDIIALQKTVIDDMAQLEERAANAASAQEKLRQMKEASTGGVEHPSVHDWDAKS